MSIFLPCNDTQPLYRLLLNAASHPGKCFSMPAFQVEAENESEYPLLMKIASCLIDHEVCYALLNQWPDPLKYELSLRTGAEETACETADFILVAGSQSHGLVCQVKRGTLSYPDLGATMIYCIDAGAISGGGTDGLHRVRLSGPGIKTPFSPQLAGLAIEEYRLLNQVNGDYPLGVDVFIIQGDRHLMAIPRSTRIEVI
jgi:alpha-D-ribose 1-methylphosphonate 5-triphosphate synthase subunit PhnH